MNKYRIAFFAACLVLAVVFVPRLANAETATSTGEVKLDGITVDEQKTVPSGWGLFWRDLTERVSIGLTFDPVKKAEKQVKFAEERIKLAELIAVTASSTANVDTRIQQMLDRGNELIANAMERKAEFLKNPDERALRLLKNLATHEGNKDNILNKIENLLPADKQALFEKKREAVKLEGDRILNAIDNPNLPPAVKEHLQNVKDRIDAAEKIKEEFVSSTKALLDRIQAGDVTAKDELDKLKAEKKSQLEGIRSEFKTSEDALKAIKDQLKADKFSSSTVKDKYKIWNATASTSVDFGNDKELKIENKLKLLKYELKKDAIKASGKYINQKIKIKQEVKNLAQ